MLRFFGRDGEVRRDDSFNEIIIIMENLIKELVPFAVLSIGLLFSLSKIYQVLHMGVNDP